MDTDRTYQPLDCSLHDQLESFATLRTEVVIRYRTPDDAVAVIEDVLVDIASRNGVEFVKLRSGLEIRLDDLDEVGGVQFRAGAARVERNRSNAVAFYDMMFNQCRPADAMAKFGGATYIQHNPMVGDGKDNFVAYFERMAREYPGKTVHIVRTVVEGDLVVLHCRQEWPGDGEWAGIDIFRMDDEGRVVEHWDVLQRVPAESKHPNSMF